MITGTASAAQFRDYLCRNLHKTSKHTHSWHELDEAEQVGLEILRRAPDNCTANQKMQRKSKTEKVHSDVPQ